MRTSSLLTRFSFVFAILLLGSSIYGQRLVEPNRLWSYFTFLGLMGDDTPHGTNMVYAFGEAEVVDDETYHRLHTGGYFDYSSIDPEGTDFLFREDTLGRVFMKEGELPEVMIYDFSLSVGETFTDPFDGCQYLVAAKDSVTLFNGELRERIVFDDSPENTWIRGIGSTQNNLLPRCGESETSLTCFQEGEDLAYHISPNSSDIFECLVFLVNVEAALESIISVYPNPFQHSLNISTEQAVLTGQQLLLYNAAGQCVIKETLDAPHQFTLSTAQLPTGIYYLHLGELRQKVIKTE